MELGQTQLCAKTSFPGEKSTSKASTDGILMILQESINVEQGEFSTEVNIPQSESKLTLQQV